MENAEKPIAPPNKDLLQTVHNGSNPGALHGGSQAHQNPKLSQIIIKKPKISPKDS